MKRITVALLILSLCLLCFGCGAPAKTQIRYESSTAYYTETGAKHSMDLMFEEPVAEGSTIAVLLDGEEILSFTTEAPFSRLQLSSPVLESGVSYNLKINGVLQCHGNSRPVAVETQPGDIPEPTLSTIPQEPMGETAVAPTESDNGSISSSDNNSSESSDSPFGTPPTIAEETISALLDHEEQAPAEVNSNGTLNIGSFIEDKVSSQNSSLTTEVEVGGTAFTITGTVSGFTSVRNAT